MEHRDQRLIQDALAELRQFRTIDERYDLIDRILGAYPLIKDALKLIDWQGGPSIVASEVVGYLNGREVAPGIPALGFIVQALAPISPTHRTALTDLLQRMKSEPSEVQAAPSNSWHDRRPLAEIVQERIIGENTLQPMYYLRRALLAADAVVRVDLYGIRKGTGFMIAPDLMMTNNHVVDTEVAAQNSAATFFNDVTDPTSDAANEPPPEVIAHPHPKALLYTNPELDFSLVRLTSCPKLRFYFSIRPAIATVSQRVIIIQHAGGYPKQISMQNNIVAMADGKVLQYYTSTSAGSSGSPVLDNDFKVIGIHTSWVHSPEWTGDELRIAKQAIDRQYRNQGTSMVAITGDLKIHAPKLLQELAIDK